MPRSAAVCNPALAWDTSLCSFSCRGQGMLTQNSCSGQLQPERGWAPGFLIGNQGATCRTAPGPTWLQIWAQVGGPELPRMEEAPGNGSCCKELCSARATGPRGCSRRTGTAKRSEGAPAGHVSWPRRRTQLVKCSCARKSLRPRIELDSRLVIYNENMRFH